MALIGHTTGAVSTPGYYGHISAAMTDMVQQGYKIEQITLHFFGMPFVQEEGQLKCYEAFETNCNITFVKPGAFAHFELQRYFSEFYKKLEGNGTYAEVKCEVELTGLRHIEENNYEKKVRTIELEMKGPLRAGLPANQQLFLE